MIVYFYKISLKTDPTQFYIGSTTSLSRRKCHHKKNVRNKVGKLYRCKLYEFIRANGGWDNFTFEKIYENDFTIKTSYMQYEQDLIDTHKPPLNTNRVLKLLKEKTPI